MFENEHLMTKVKFAACISVGLRMLVWKKAALTAACLIQLTATKILADATQCGEVIDADESPTGTISSPTSNGER